MEIEEHGFFKWSSEEDNVNGVAGVLKITPTGVITLELHQTLTGRDGTEAVFGSGQSLPNKAIIGVLKSQGKHVLLRNLRTNGGRVGLIAFENFIARECFISSVPVQADAFTQLYISLAGLEDWTCWAY